MVNALMQSPRRAYVVTYLPAGFGAADAATLTQRVRRHVGLGETRHVADLSALETLEPGTISALISALRIVREAGGDLRLVVPPGKLTDSLYLAALEKIFRVFATMSEFEDAEAATPRRSSRGRLTSA